VHKVARAGATISLIKNSLRDGKRVVLITPNKRIYRHIEQAIPKIVKPQPRIACILPNDELCCKLVPLSGLKFRFKENCYNCEHNGKPETCLLQKLLKKDFDVYCLTYDKLLALQLSQSREAKILLDKLLSCDVFILDEFTTAVLREIPTLAIVEIDENGNVRRLSEQVHREIEKASKLETPNDLVNGILFPIIEEFLKQVEKITESGRYPNKCIDVFNEKELKEIFRDGWRYIEELTAKGCDTSLLQEVVLVVFRARELYVLCEDGSVTATPVVENALDYLRRFCAEIPEDKPVFLIDSYQPMIDFDHIFERKAEHFVWGTDGDPLGTDKQQIVIVDTAHYGAPNFIKDENLRSRIEYFIKDLLREFPPKSIIVVTTNKQIAAIISRWNLPKGILITWHRSDLMRGVSVENRRIMICIGGPYLPKSAYVPHSRSFDFRDFAEELESLSSEEREDKIAKLLRADDTKSEFINAIARVKDPKAEERSVVFTLGMTELDVKALLKQPREPYVSRPRVIRPLRSGGLGKDGIWIAKLWLEKADVKTDDLPLIARIIRYVYEKQHVRASEILPGNRELVVKKALQYENVLTRYDVKVQRKRGGVSFSLKEIGGDVLIERAENYGESAELRSQTLS